MSSKTIFQNTVIWENIYNYTCIYVNGLFDAISLHRTLPTLVNNTATVYIILKIFGANIGLIIGSELLFRKGIAPFIEAIGDKVLDLQDNNQFTSLLYLIYQSLWLIPICVLCYVCCLSWYQELADCIEKSHNKGKKPPNPITAAQYAIYGFLTWLFAFLQVQLLTGILPTAIQSAWYVVHEILKDRGSTNESDILSVTQQAANIQLTIFSLKGLIHSSLFVLLHLLKYLSLTSGFILMAILYAWYAFDPKWISLGKTPNERFGLIEKYFFYFLGYGTPFVILNRATSFFIGFGSFLTIFPFSIILGSVLNYADSYAAYEMREVKPVRIFRMAQVWTLTAIKIMGKEARNKAVKGSSLSTSTFEEEKDDANKKKLE